MPTFFYASPSSVEISYFGAFHMLDLLLLASMLFMHVSFYKNPTYAKSIKLNFIMDVNIWYKQTAIVTITYMMISTHIQFKACRDIKTWFVIDRYHLSVI